MPNESTDMHATLKTQSYVEERNRRAKYNHSCSAGLLIPKDVLSRSWEFKLTWDSFSVISLVSMLGFGYGLVQKYSFC